MIQRSTIFWFTGLSGAGKSTLANGLRDALVKKGQKVLILDGDDVRAHLHRQLGFTPEDIRLNNNLIIDLCEKYRDDYDYILVPIISPYTDSRALARRRLSPGFYEIYVHAPIDILHNRDTKGLYSAVRRNELNNVIGVSPGSPYHVPENPDFITNTGVEPLEQVRTRLFSFAWSSRCPTTIDGRAI